MQFKLFALALAAGIPQTLAHGVITSITGANGVTMPGLSVIDGTPRDCASPLCGAEADTSIIRRGGSPLGKTNGGGQVDAAAAVAKFMGNGATAANRYRRGLLDGLLGGGAGGAGKGGFGQTKSSAANAVGVKTPRGTSENAVAQSAGSGATSGLPTVGSDGVITMNFHQVNQDGAGPLQASIDPTSGGTDESAFQTVSMIADVPGIGVGGLSGTTTTDFPIKVQMPAGMTCSGTVAGVNNVCVVRVKNSALAGPFGGSAVFTQSSESGSSSGLGTSNGSGSSSSSSESNTPDSNGSGSSSGQSESNTSDSTSSSGSSDSSNSFKSFGSTNV